MLDHHHHFAVLDDVSMGSKTSPPRTPKAVSSLVTGLSPALFRSNSPSRSLPPSNSMSQSPSRPSTPVPSPVAAKVVSPAETVYQDPNWLKDLKRNFSSEIISPCSARARSAVADDEYIQVWLALFAHIKN